MRDVFISYAREDEQTAGAIAASFERLGLTCFLDTRDIGAGDNWLQVLARGVEECAVLVCLLSQHPSHYREKEIRHAIDLGKRVVPVVLSRAVQFPPALQFLVADLQNIFVDRSIEVALPELFASTLPWVDRNRHRTAYTAYTRLSSTIDEEDVDLRSDVKAHLNAGNASIGPPEHTLGDVSILNGRYVFRSASGSFAGHAFNGVPELTDFIVDARIRRTEGSIDGWFGIEFGFGGNRADHCYQFLLNGRRLLRVTKYFTDEWKDPIPSHKPQTFSTGGPFELLKIVRNGGNIHVSLNGGPAAALVDYDIVTGRIGPIIDERLTVEYSDILIRGVSSSRF